MEQGANRKIKSREDRHSGGVQARLWRGEEEDRGRERSDSGALWSAAQGRARGERATEAKGLRASGAELGWQARARWWAVALLGLLA